jgi:hypothetical protein
LDFLNRTAAAMRDATSSQCTLHEASQAGCRPSLIVGHDLFGKPLHTFPDFPNSPARANVPARGVAKVHVRTRPFYKDKVRA